MRSACVVSNELYEEKKICRAPGGTRPDRAETLRAETRLEPSSRAVGVPPQVNGVGGVKVNEEKEEKLAAPPGTG